MIAGEEIRKLGNVFIENKFYGQNEMFLLGAEWNGNDLCKKSTHH